MADWFLGLLFGVSVGMFIVIGGDALQDTESRPADRNIIWISEDKDLTCRLNENYPKLNCTLIKEAIGPKLVTKPDNEIVIDGG